LLKVVFLNYVYSEIDIQTNCFKGVKLS